MKRMSEIERICDDRWGLAILNEFKKEFPHGDIVFLDVSMYVADCFTHPGYLWYNFIDHIETTYGSKYSLWLLGHTGGAPEIPMSKAIQDEFLSLHSKTNFSLSYTKKAWLDEYGEFKVDNTYHE
jgi:hypothetical protein